MSPRPDVLDVARFCELRPLAGREHGWSTICHGDVRHKIPANEVELCAAIGRAVLAEIERAR